MAFTIYETWISGEGTVGKDAEDTYIGILRGLASDDADDPYVASTIALTAFSPLSPFGNVFSNMRRHRLAPLTWEMTATYRSYTEQRQTNDASFSFTTGGGSQHISHSISTVNKYTNADDDDDIGAIDFKQGINCTSDSVEGVDIHVRTFDFKTTFYIAPANMSSGYVDTLFNCTGCVNSDTVSFTVDGVQLTFEPGELLLLGAEGSKRQGISDWEVALSWSALPNASNLTVGDIENITKNGWDYLWVYVTSDSTVNLNTLIQNAAQVNVEQVYQYVALTPCLQPAITGQTNSQPWQTPGYTSGGGVSNSYAY